MRIRIIVAALILVTVGGALVAAEGWIRRPVSFEVIAQTEVVEGRIERDAGDLPLVFEVLGAQICDGIDFLGLESDVSGPCVGFTRVIDVDSGDVEIRRAVDARVLRRGKGDFVVELTAGEQAGPGSECEGGIAASLMIHEQRRTLCSPARIVVGASVTPMPRLALSGDDALIGHALGEVVAVGTPSMIGGSVVMRSSSLFRDVGRFLSGQDIGADRFAIDVGKRSLVFGEKFSACREINRCGPDAAKPAPFAAVVGAHQGGGLTVHAHIVGVAGVVDSYGSRGEILVPRWFARLRSDPYVGWLYMISAFLVGLLIKADRWLFGGGRARKKGL